MTANEYQKSAMRTTSSKDPEDLILQGVMGMCGEAGEAIDIVKKWKFQGHPMDVETRFHLIKELGDVLWYVATCAEGLGVDLEEVMRLNIDKLKKRYPDKFDPECSIHRKEGDI